ncbi:MAG: hypothetical protein RDV48_29250 [Candidatus Eremiobacteraeota bacterium]|nr:hypothetical protein [Candidatus Eremiobacteraeota bacterium]
MNSPKSRTGGHSPGGSEGFSLLEIVIAMGILLLVLFSLGVVIPYSRAKMVNTAHQDLAASWAEEKADELRALPWDTVQATYLNKDVYDNYSDKFSAGNDGTTAGGFHEIEFHRCVMAETDKDIYGNDIPDLMKVSILIFWDESGRPTTDQTGTRLYRDYKLSTKVYRGQ